MKIAICDSLGLCYDGTTLSKRGLGGSESAVILIAKELNVLGFDVTVFNNCRDGSNSEPGTYDGVRYIDNTDAKQHHELYDVVIVSRSTRPFLTNDWPFLHTAKKKMLWIHDTFIEGDNTMEDLAVAGKIDHIFTLSDWHTSYILTCVHGKKRNYEVLKSKIFQTRNGAVCHIPEVSIEEKDPNHFVYNASATKGMVPLVDHIWPKIKERLPQARLTIIGGYYRFREGAAPDAQENTVAKYAERQDLKDLGITFTGVIPQHEIAKILANAWMMLYPGAFPETFGISTLESLLYKTPLVTTRFGALEETALDLACYQIDYAIEPNSLFPHINKEKQIDRFVNEVLSAFGTPYLHQQKQNYCDVVKDIAGWNTVALQWKQFFYSILGQFLPVDEYRTVTRINDKVSRIFGRTSIMPQIKQYKSYGGEQKRIVVVSPFWNAEKYIEKNILSVASQDYNNYKHILIDDASADDSYFIARKTIDSLPGDIRDRFILIQNETNVGAISNQLSTVRNHTKTTDVVMLLDGDDWLINNNTIFHYYNDLYSRGYEFTYGSMWSLADNIPLIAQEYPRHVKEAKSYRQHHFNWKIPYTHLRTCLAYYFYLLDEVKFKDGTGNWMKSGADNPLFYELIERIDDPDKIYCNREIVCNYNDANPLNDYKIRGEEQNQNANRSYTNKETKVKRILIGTPTAKYIESETVKSLWDLEVPDGYKLDLQFFYGYQTDQVRNLIAEWAKNYDYLLSVDSDIILPKNALIKMLAADKDIISGLYIQRIPNTHTLEVYMDTPNGGCTNIPHDLIQNRGVVEIAACGMGAALIKGEVFRRMSYPHFHYTSALDHKNTVSEDVYFCMKARGIGFKVWADSSILCDHKGTHLYRVQTQAAKIPEKSHLQKVAEQDLLPIEHAKYLPKMGIQPKVIYDIGACVQHWTRKAKEVWPDAKYYLLDAAKSVEPFLAASGDEYAIAVLSDHDGRVVDFYEDANNPGGNSYYLETTGAFTDKHKTKRITSTLKSIVKNSGWKKPDLIKMDVQGAELDILLGMGYLLDDVMDIIIECQHTEYNVGAPQIGDIQTFLESRGFELTEEICRNQNDGDYHFSRVL
jgi:FkbM family methyltransferase